MLVNGAFRGLFRKPGDAEVAAGGVGGAVKTNAGCGILPGAFVALPYPTPQHGT
jgi:hypothetical protein